MSLWCLLGGGERVMKFLGEESMNPINIPHITGSYMKMSLFQMVSKTYSICRQKEIWTK